MMLYLSQQTDNKEVQTVNMEFRSLVHAKFKSEAACADKMGWSRQRLNKISTGKKLPDLEELNVLSATLDTPIETLFYIFLPVKSTNGQQKQAGT